MRYTFFNGHPKFRFSSKILKGLLKNLQIYCPLRYDSLSIAFLDEKTLTELHKRFLNDDTVTDVITFSDYLEADERMGEVCISVDEAVKRAPEFGQTFTDEITLYLIHGWLHLKGYDDHTEKEIQAMRNAEKKLQAFLLEKKLSLDCHMAE